MLKILVVEDDHSKLKKISAALGNVKGIDIDHIDNVIDARSAKLRLRDTCFDLLILDIAIPQRIDEDARKDGGLNLLRELMQRDLYNMPTHIVCLTGYQDVHEKALDEISGQMIPFLLCDATSDGWIRQLQSHVSRALTAKSCRPVSPDSYDAYLAIVCALESPELRAVLRNGWKWQRIPIPNDATVYYEASIEKTGAVKRCYAAASPRKGMPAAAVLSTKMISTFKPRYISMTGITSGYVGRTKLGDVIAADPVWDWGSGKWIKRNTETVFEPESHQLDLEVDVRNKLRLMAQDTPTLSRIRKEWPGGDTPEHELTLHLGPLASGSAVLADSDTHHRILQQHRGLLGIEMESYAVFCAAQEAAMPRPTVFVLKSVVDFADGEKNDRYHNYASYTSAQVLKHFAENYL